MSDLALFIFVALLCLRPVETLIFCGAVILFGAVGLALAKLWAAMSGLAFFGLIALGAWVVIGIPLALGNLPQSK